VARTPGAEVTSIGVDVLAEHGDLAHAVGRERGDLRDDVAQPAAHLAAPHLRDDAEGARVVAADLDRHPRGVRRLPERGERGGVRLVLLEDLDDRPLFTRPGEQAGCVAQVVGAEHDVDVARTRHDRVTVLLREAATDGDLQVGAELLERLERPEMAVELLVRVLPDAARVQDDDIGVLEAAGRFHPVGGEHPGDALGIVLVHLAAVGPDEVAAGHRWRRGHGDSV
jgi:hypothetical protein